MRPAITIAVEGVLDEAVLRRIADEAGLDVSQAYGKAGKQPLLRALRGYNNAARYSPWLVLVDLDQDGDCPPPALANWLPYPAPMMALRVAVREVEAWLLADREGLAAFLAIPPSRLPDDPESVDHPKQRLVQLAEGSPRRYLRADLVPRGRRGVLVGPGYTSRLSEFVARRWNPEAAASRSESLRRCRERLGGIAAHAQAGG